MSALVRSVAIGGWSLVLGEDEEPLARDVELAERLGFARPRDIRKLVERMLRDGTLNDSDVRATVARTRVGIAERSVVEYLLTETGALLVTAKSETAKANAITRQVVEVFVAARRGLLAPTATLEHPARVGDNALLRREMASLCDVAAKMQGVSVRRVHGYLRTEFRVSGPYLLPISAWSYARDQLFQLARRTLLLPPRPGRAANLRLLRGGAGQLELNLAGGAP